MLTKLEEMLRDAQAKYNDAARMHSMGRVGHFGGRVSALKEVIELFKQ
tara:strand:+ start:750 stop:893 length:144 start_codon:yes stop_codon:yes gene_type:complete